MKFNLGFLWYWYLFTICKRLFLNNGLVPECLTFGEHGLYTVVTVLKTVELVRD